MSKVEKRNREKKTLIYLTISFVILCLVAVFVVHYANYRNEETRFPNGSEINGIDVSNLNAQEANISLSDHYKNKNIKIVDESMDTEKISLEPIVIDMRGELSEYIKHNFKNFISNYMLKHTIVATVPIKYQWKDNYLRKKIENLKIFDLNKSDRIDSEDAYVKLEKPDFPVVPEVYGNVVDKEKLVQQIEDNISRGDFHKEIKIYDFYIQPKIKRGDEILKEKRNFAKKYLVQEIIYKVGDNKIMLSPEELNRIIEFRKDQEPTYNEANTRDLIKELSDGWDTYGRNFTFKTINGNKVRVKGGVYGNRTDLIKESRQLIKDLKSQKNIERKPIYRKVAKFGPIDNSKKGIHVEVDLDKQRAWLVKDGKILVETPLVSGNIKGDHDTPTGIYVVTYKDKDAKLRGLNDDGTRYETPVEYWMPFNGDIGMHDAKWRNKFGGNIYKWNGTHGCLNMPFNKAKKIFYNIEAGVPVVLYRNAEKWTK